MDPLKKLTDEGLKEIYTNEKFRNEVAYAHQCCKSTGEFMYKKTCGYPKEYIVTDEQIAEAEKELARAKKETLKKHKKDLLFVGMGMTYETDTDIGNYRIRTEFLNAKGHKFFVELGSTCDHLYTRCDHSIDRDLEEIHDKQSNAHLHQSDFYNYAGLERNNILSILRYTPENILNLVNKIFDCKFKRIVIDNYSCSCNGLMCESPKKN